MKPCIVMVVNHTSFLVGFIKFIWRTSVACHLTLTNEPPRHILFFLVNWKPLDSKCFKCSMYKHIFSIKLIYKSALQSFCLLVKSYASSHDYNTSLYDKHVWKHHFFRWINSVLWLSTFLGSYSKTSLCK